MNISGARLHLSARGMLRGAAERAKEKEQQRQWQQRQLGCFYV
jgi:hypothetical protein